MQLAQLDQPGCGAGVGNSCVGLSHSPAKAAAGRVLASTLQRWPARHLNKHLPSDLFPLIISPTPHVIWIGEKKKKKGKVHDCLSLNTFLA